MSTNLLGGVVGRGLSKLPHSYGLVGADGEDGAAIGGETGVEDGGIVLVIDYYILYVISVNNRDDIYSLCETPSAIKWSRADVH